MRSDTVKAAMQIGYELDCAPGIADLAKTLGCQASDSTDGFAEGNLFFVGEHTSGSLVWANDAVEKLYSSAHSAVNQMDYQGSKEKTFPESREWHVTNT